MGIKINNIMKRGSKEFFEAQKALLDVIKKDDKLDGLKFRSVKDPEAHNFGDVIDFLVTTKSVYTMKRIKTSKGERLHVMFTVQPSAAYPDKLYVIYNGNLRVRRELASFSSSIEDLKDLAGWENRIQESKKAAKAAKSNKAEVIPGGFDKIRNVVAAASVNIGEELLLRFKEHYAKEAADRDSGVVGVKLPKYQNVEISDDKIQQEVNQLMQGAIEVLARRIADAGMAHDTLEVSIRRTENDSRGRFLALATDGEKYISARSILAWGSINAPHFRYLTKV